MIIANEHGDYAEEHFGNTRADSQREASGSSWTLCSALTTVVVVAAALMALWRVPTTPDQNWLIVAVVALGLVGCIALRYGLLRR